MTFRSSWSAGRRKRRQWEQPEPGDRAGVLWGGRAAARRRCTGPEWGQARALECGTHGGGRGRSGEAAARFVSDPGTRRGTAGRRGPAGRTQRPPLRFGPHRLAAAASPWLQPLGTSSGASRSPTSTGRRSRPEVARREPFTTTSRAASARHLRPSLGNPGSEDWRRAGRGCVRSHAREGWRGACVGASWRRRRLGRRPATRRSVWSGAGWSLCSCVLARLSPGCSRASPDLAKHTIPARGPRSDPCLLGKNFELGAPGSPISATDGSEQRRRLLKRPCRPC